MNVILKKDIKELGKKDSMVNVSDGYAKNYLLPRGFAIEATAGNVNEMKDKQKSVAAKKDKELQNAKDLAAIIDGKDIIIKAKSGDSGKLFGAVSNKDVADEIKLQYKLNIDKKKIEMDPIKCLGTHDVEAKIYPGVTAKFIVKVEAL